MPVRKTPQSEEPIRQAVWRLRAATVGGALTALGLGVLFNAHAGAAVASSFEKGLSTVVSLTGLFVVVASAARAPWFVRLRAAQAIGTIPVALIGLVAVSLHDDELFTAAGLLGLVAAPVLLWLILAGVQLAAWQPGAPKRMQREIDRLHAELDRAMTATRGRR